MENYSVGPYKSYDHCLDHQTYVLFQQDARNTQYINLKPNILALRLSILQNDFCNAIHSKSVDSKKINLNRFSNNNAYTDRLLPDSHASDMLLNQYQDSQQLKNGVLYEMTQLQYLAE